MGAKVSFEHNFEKEKEYLIRDFKSINSHIEEEIELNMNKIKSQPVPPPDDDDWKVLEQFESYYPNGIVCAHYLTHYDRMVYEYYPKTIEIIFTNCRGHYYRTNRYSSSEIDNFRYFSKRARDYIFNIK